jgi:hypothetical protein
MRLLWLILINRSFIPLIVSQSKMCINGSCLVAEKLETIHETGEEKPPATLNVTVENTSPNP